MGPALIAFYALRLKKENNREIVFKGQGFKDGDDIVCIQYAYVSTFLHSYFKGELTMHINDVGLFTFLISPMPQPLHPHAFLTLKY